MSIKVFYVSNVIELQVVLTLEIRLKSLFSSVNYFIYLFLKCALFTNCFCNIFVQNWCVMLLLSDSLFCVYYKKQNI